MNTIPLYMTSFKFSRSNRLKIIFIKTIKSYIPSSQQIQPAKYLHDLNAISYDIEIKYEVWIMKPTHTLNTAFRISLTFSNFSNYIKQNKIIFLIYIHFKIKHFWIGAKLISQTHFYLQIVNIMNIYFINC